MDYDRSGNYVYGKPGVLLLCSSGGGLAGEGDGPLVSAAEGSSILSEHKIYQEEGAK